MTRNGPPPKWQTPSAEHARASYETGALRGGTLHGATEAPRWGACPDGPHARSRGVHVHPLRDHAPAPHAPGAPHREVMRQPGRTPAHRTRERCANSARRGAPPDLDVRRTSSLSAHMIPIGRATPRSGLAPHPAGSCAAPRHAGASPLPSVRRSVRGDAPEGADPSATGAQ